MRHWTHIRSRTLPYGGLATNGRRISSSSSFARLLPRLRTTADECAYPERPECDDSITPGCSSGLHLQTRCSLCTQSSKAPNSKQCNRCIRRRNCLSICSVIFFFFACIFCVLMLGNAIDVRNLIIRHFDNPVEREMFCSLTSNYIFIEQSHRVAILRLLGWNTFSNRTTFIIRGCIHWTVTFRHIGLHHLCTSKDASKNHFVLIFLIELYF